jgi:hypothetical protein
MGGLLRQAGENWRGRLDRSTALSAVVLAPHEPLPDGAIERIVAAVGRAPSNSDPECDLLSDLEGIVSFYRTNVGVWESMEKRGPKAKLQKVVRTSGRGLRDAPERQQRRADRVVATAKKLKDLIADDWFLSIRHTRALDRLITDVRAKTPVSIGPPTKWQAFLGVGQHHSAFDILIGQLGRAFEQYWGEPPGYTRDPVTDELRGYFIDFVEAALNEMGISGPKGDPYTRSSIAHSLSKVKT